MSSQQNKPREQVSKFMQRNFPQIRMHGGESSIVDIDKSEGTVHIQLSGACSGCGISPMTIQAIKRRLTDDLDWVSTVQVTTGMGSSLDTPQINTELASEDDTDDTGPEAPF